MITALSSPEIACRVLAALVAGLVVGLERESHGRAAGLRTTTLACVASALAMMLSEKLFIESAGAGNAWRADPARLGAGILTGIGFLGAGTILRHANVIRGVTTAASLWFVAVLGLAFGSGAFVLGFTGLLVAVLVLYLLPILEKRVQTDWYGALTVTLGLDAMSEEELRRRLKAHGLKVKAVEFSCDLAAGQKTITCELKMKRKSAFALSTQLLAELRVCPGVLQVKWS
jgi:putative Mg2+ transporter-C (MgtC) family protein